MNTKYFITAVFFAAAGLIMGFTSIQNRDADQKKDMISPAMSSVPSKGDQFHAAMDRLWEEHIGWTRNVILCLTDQLPGTDQAVKRLLQNQEDIGNAVKPFYGNEAGDKLTALLKQHIIIAADVVTAAKNGDSGKLDEAGKNWYANADEISQLLSGANPEWKLADMKMMMDTHLKLTTDEAVARIHKDYDADISAFNQVQDEILKMSDMLADGIISQFPDKF
jgi:hypothetical protein